MRSAMPEEKKTLDASSSSENIKKETPSKPKKTKKRTNISCGQCVSIFHVLKDFLDHPCVKRKPKVQDIPERSALDEKEKDAKLQEAKIDCSKVEAVKEPVESLRNQERIPADEVKSKNSILDQDEAPKEALVESSKEKTCEESSNGLETNAVDDQLALLTEEAKTSNDNINEVLAEIEELKEVESILKPVEYFPEDLTPSADVKQVEDNGEKGGESCLEETKQDSTVKESLHCLDSEKKCSSEDNDATPKDEMPKDNTEEKTDEKNDEPINEELEETEDIQKRSESISEERVDDNLLMDTNAEFNEQKKVEESSESENSIQKDITTCENTDLPIKESEEGTQEEQKAEEKLNEHDDSKIFENSGNKSPLTKEIEETKAITAPSNRKASHKKIFKILSKTGKISKQKKPNNFRARIIHLRVISNIIEDSSLRQELPGQKPQDKSKDSVEKDLTLDSKLRVILEKMDETTPYLKIQGEHAEKRSEEAIVESQEPQDKSKDSVEKDLTLDSKLRVILEKMDETTPYLKIQGEHAEKRSEETIVESQEPQDKSKDSVEKDLILDSKLKVTLEKMNETTPYLKIQEEKTETRSNEAIVEKSNKEMHGTMTLPDYNQPQVAEISEIPSRNISKPAEQSRPKNPAPKVDESLAKGNSNASKIEAILKKRSTRGKIEYLSKRKGNSSQQNSWESRKTIPSKKLIKEFNSKQKNTLLRITIPLKRVCEIPAAAVIVPEPVVKIKPICKTIPKSSCEDMNQAKRTAPAPKRFRSGGMESRERIVTIPIQRIHTPLRTPTRPINTSLKSLTSKVETLKFKENETKASVVLVPNSKTPGDFLRIRAENAETRWIDNVGSTVSIIQGRKPDKPEEPEKEGFITTELCSLSCNPESPTHAALSRGIAQNPLIQDNQESFTLPSTEFNPMDSMADGSFSELSYSNISLADKANTETRIPANETESPNIRDLNSRSERQSNVDVSEKRLSGDLLRDNYSKQILARCATKLPASSCTFTGRKLRREDCLSATPRHMEHARSPCIVQLVKSVLPLTLACNLRKLAGGYMFRQVFTETAEKFRTNKCLLCPRNNFGPIGELIRHYKEAHGLDSRLTECAFEEGTIYISSQSEYENNPDWWGSCDRKTCRIKFRLVEDLRRHYREEHQLKAVLFTESSFLRFEALVHCSLCSRESSTFDQHCSHLSVDHGRTVSRCRLCHFFSSQSQILLEHVGRVHSEALKTDQCTACGSKIQESTLEQHVVVTHSKTRGPLKTCALCDSAFSNQDQLFTHFLSSHHMKTAPESRIVSPRVSSECTLCHATFASKMELMKHLNDCRQNRSLNQHHRLKYSEEVCFRCNLTFGSSQQCLKHMHHKHMRWVEKNPKQDACYQASEEGRLAVSSIQRGPDFMESLGDFPTPQQLNRLAIDPKQRMSCDVCTEIFPSYFKLYSHMYSAHHLVKRFRCDLSTCLKTFISPAAFRNHIVYHGQVSKYSCVICHVVFANGEDQNNHMRTIAHMDKERKEHERKLVEEQNRIQLSQRRTREDNMCPYVSCREKFISSLELENHIRTHVKAFKSKELRKKTNSKRPLKQNHMEVKPKRPVSISCQGCLANYSTQQEFDDHFCDDNIREQSVLEGSNYDPNFANASMAPFALYDQHQQMPEQFYTTQQDSCMGVAHSEIVPQDNFQNNQFDQRYFYDNQLWPQQTTQPGSEAANSNLTQL